MQKLLGLLTVFCEILSLCSCLRVRPFQPNVPQGGRAVSIGVKPTDNQKIFVASETGGLFVTGNGGANWHHIRNLANFGVNDVASGPSAPNIVIATAGADFKNANNGVIWRSSNGGNTWSQPAGSIPPSGTRCGSRVNAYSVAFESGSNNVYVGTDCGLAVSHDLGVTWTHLVPDPTVAVNSDKTQNRVFCVLAQGGGKINLAAEDGLWFSTNGGISWTKATTGPGAAQGGVAHAFAASPYDSRHLFHAGQWQQLYQSNDGGANWTQVPANGVWNRPVFVRTTKTGTSNQFYVYFGDGQNLWRQVFTEQASGPTGSGTWTQVGVDHSDPADIAFDDSRTSALLLATDGGVHKTSDNGANWTFTGGGLGGYNALQMTEVTGQADSATGARHNLYYGTQDNDVVGSVDGGATWPNHLCCEGFFLRTEPTTASTAKVTGVDCGACFNFLADPGLVNVMGWPNAPGGPPNPNINAGNPFLLPQPANYIQNTVDTSVSPQVNTFMLTTNTGGSWTSSFTTPQELRGIPGVAGPASNPTVYQAVRRPGTTPDGQDLVGLVKTTNLYGPGPAVVSNADVAGFGGLGIFPTMFAWYTVFAVQPSDANHLIIPDIDTNQMKISGDGGQTWSVDQALTDLVTSKGTYDFREGPFVLVHSIAFDPSDSCHILVGTAQNGIIRSTDGGQSWYRIKGSRQVGNLSSFYFPPHGPVIVSTYGRGMWQLVLKRRRRFTCTLRVPPFVQEAVPTIVDPTSGARVQFKDLGNPEICPQCQFIIVFNGAITNVRMDGNQVVQIFMSGGSIYQVDANKKEVLLQIPNAYSTTMGTFNENRAFQSVLKEKTPIRGLVVEGKTLKGIIASRAQLPFHPARIPYVRVVSNDLSGGVPRTGPNGKVTVEGEGFAPNTPAQVRLGTEIVADNVPVNENGSFRVQIEIKRMPGDYEISVEQKEGKRTSLDKTTIKVVPQDQREKNERGNQPPPPK